MSSVKKLTMKKLTITLPNVLTDLIEAKIATGRYTSADEVVCESLSALQQRENDLDRWLEEEVIPVYDANLVCPERVISWEKAKVSLDEYMDKAAETGC
jgi:antitoxin ParD1/3/4